uniref:Complement component receptor 1-like protein n=1 Tax=Crassostrea virginica TaxID=6565 RepID=A0A8B8CAX6_CRAVI|nr:complement component receptor 1-like protein [Crassostrea virginica]
MGNCIFWIAVSLIFALSINNINQVCATRFCDTTWISKTHPNMIVTPSVSKLSYGEEVFFSCKPGYLLHGPNRSECMSNGRIPVNTMTFYCEDLGIHCEHRQLDQPHLTVSPIKDIYRYNEEVSLRCDEGYILRVPSSARCTEDFVFDIPSTSVCEAEVRCHKSDSKINVLHLVVTPSKDEYRYNETVSLECEEGYTLQGPSTATCQQEFNILSPPSCIATYCDASWIYQQSHDIVYSSNSDPSKLKVGESINFSCRRGHRLRGARSVKCLPSGELEGDGLLSYCEQIRCSRNTELGDIISTPDKNFYDFNETIHFQCAGDKTVYGPTSARCSEQGWEYEGSSMPVCANRYCDVTWLHRQGMYLTPNVDGKAPVGTRLQANCLQNKRLRCGKSAVCMPNGRLNGIEHMCFCEGE